MHFNSIKVRLELGFITSINRRSKFQFHKGAIRTFDFEKIPVVDRYFNSIKVRLEPKGIMIPISPNKFQFHKGAIRTSGKSNYYHC